MSKGKRGPTSPLARFLAKKHQGEGSRSEISDEQMEVLQSILDSQRAMQDDFKEFREELKANRARTEAVADKYVQLETNVSSIDTDCKDLASELGPGPGLFLSHSSGPGISGKSLRRGIP